jgi:hypothetical protein
MAIQNLQQLRIRFGQNALDCDELAGKQLRPEHRALLQRTAEHYRMLADKFDESRLRWNSLMKSLEIARTSWLPPRAQGQSLTTLLRFGSSRDLRIAISRKEEPTGTTAVRESGTAA